MSMVSVKQLTNNFVGTKLREEKLSWKRKFNGRTDEKQIFLTAELYRVESMELITFKFITIYDKRDSTSGMTWNEWRNSGLNPPHEICNTVFEVYTS